MKHDPFTREKSSHIVVRALAASSVDAGWQDISLHVDNIASVLRYPGDTSMAQILTGQGTVLICANEFKNVIAGLAATRVKAAGATAESTIMEGIQAQIAEAERRAAERQAQQEQAERNSIDEERDASNVIPGDFTAADVEGEES